MGDGGIKAKGKVVNCSLAAFAMAAGGQWDDSAAGALLKCRNETASCYVNRGQGNTKLRSHAIRSIDQSKYCKQQ